jgi:predicted O-methyltransferase YrrM
VIKNITIDEKLENYISDNTYSLHPIQKEIVEHNNELGELKRMQISVTQGYFLQLIIKLNNVKNVLEVGTFTGYSALSMALSLPKEGTVTCLDNNREISKNAEKYFKKANLDNKIKIILNNALESMKNLINDKKNFDLIFIDADKENYTNYYNLSFHLLNKNGLIIIDNVLWKGEVSNLDKNDRLTKAIRDFNSFVKKDIRFEKTILPLGDGLTICRKI